MSENEKVVGDPRPGDVWQDLDPRRDRHVKVIQIYPQDKIAEVRSTSGGPRSLVRFDRFRPSRGREGALGKKGYVLVQRGDAVLSTPTGSSTVLHDDLGSSHDDA